MTPDDWTRTVLGAVADTALGKMLDKAKNTGRERVPYLRNVNVQWGRIDTDDVLTMEIDTSELDRFAVRDGDLLACEGGDIGRAAIWRGDGQYMAYQKALHRIRPSASLESYYLRYLLEYYAHAGVLARYSTGSTIAHLPQQRLRALPVALPTVTEQRRIVEIVEDHLSHLDAADSSLHAAVRRVSVLAAAALHSWMTGPSQRLGELTVKSGYGTSTKCAVNGSGDPVARIPNIVKGHLDMTDAKFVVDPNVDVSALHLKEGDLLIVRTNGSRDLIGRCAVVSEDHTIAFASYLIRYQVDRSRLHPDWARLALTAPMARAQIESAAASSAGQHNLSVAKLNSIAIPCPSVHEQARALQRIRAFESEVHRLHAPLHQGLLRSKALRRAVLAAAFSGRLTGASTDTEIIEEVAQA